MRKGTRGAARPVRQRRRIPRPPLWRDLTSWGRLSLVGLGLAAVVAIGLGLFIPRKVELHMLRAQADSNRQVLEALLRTKTLPAGGSTTGFAELDSFVNASIVRGDFVRVKLWSPQGQILYSDDRRLIGKYFAPTPQLRNALSGNPQSELTDLSEPENRLERGLASKLMEFYLPVVQGGRVVAVWEVYQSLDRFEVELGRVRLAVWVSVGFGLSVLLVFLASAFGSLLATVQHRRREAEDRSRDLAALLQVSRAATGSLDPGRLSQEAVEAIRREGGFRAVALTRLVGPRSRPTLVSSSRDPSCPTSCLLQARSGLGHHAPGFATFALKLGGATDNLMLVACRDESQGFAPEERVMLETAGEQVRMALENAGLYASLSAAQHEQRRLTSRLVSAHEDERKRIVGEIHDGLGQDLHRVLFGLRGCRSSPPDEVTQELARLEEITHASISRLRRLLEDLRPSTLEDVGLAASLRGLADRARKEDRLDVELRGDHSISQEPPVEVRLAVFRITQEGLRNVAKHAGATRAVVELRQDDRTLRLTITDEGRGIPPGGGDGIGLWLMRERAEALGGTFSISSRPGGTRLVAEIPTGANA